MTRSVLDPRGHMSSYASRTQEVDASRRISHPLTSPLPEGEEESSRQAMNLGPSSSEGDGKDAHDFWRSVFGTDYPVEVEIGPGTGTFILAAAEREPEATLPARPALMSSMVAAIFAATAGGTSKGCTEA